MDILDRLRTAPRRITTPIAAAAGMAAGFYPRSFPAPTFFAAACALAGLGLAVRGLFDRARPDGRCAETGPRVWRALALACSLGLVAGVALARDDEARGLFQASSLFAARKAVARPSGPAPRASDEPARTGSAATPLATSSLVLAAIEGRLVADSSLVKGGFRSYTVAVSRMKVVGPAVSGELRFAGRPPGTLRVLARGGPILDAGASLAASGSAGKGGGAIFASPGGIVVRERGERIDRVRSGIRAAFRTALVRVGARSAGLLEALLLGARDGLEAEVSDVFKAAGCSHILALSGQHLSVLAVLVVAALKPLGGPRRARIGAALVAGAFVWIAGPGPSLLRAVIMAWIGAIALVLDRPQEWLGLLALSFLVALPADSAAARSLGFLLSYLAVWGLAVIAPRFRFLLDPILPPVLSAAAAASLGAQAATSPLVAFSFGALQFMGIFASMLSAPLVTALMWWGIGAAAFCSLVPQAAGAAALVSDFLYDLLVGVMRAAASVPPIALPGPIGRIAASAAVAMVAGLVYAYPWMAYKRHTSPPASGR